DPDDVREGVIASRIAAHAADIAKGVKGAAERDRKMAIARKKLDWEEQARLSLNPTLAHRVHSKHSSEGKACSMCGKFCAMELVEKYLNITAIRC
ncbi:MAG: phosphomethylpyrimidine synthase ThiC, partial [Dehalococcoidia bacterium]